MLYFPFNSAGREENYVEEDYYNSFRKVTLDQNFTSLTMDRNGNLEAVKLNPIQEVDGEAKFVPARI